MPYTTNTSALMTKRNSTYDFEDSFRILNNNLMKINQFQSLKSDDSLYETESKN